LHIASKIVVLLMCIVWVDRSTMHHWLHSSHLCRWWNSRTLCNDYLWLWLWSFFLLLWWCDVTHVRGWNKVALCDRVLLLTRILRIQMVGYGHWILLIWSKSMVTLRVHASTQWIGAPTPIFTTLSISC
jgi:hypothetical protein